MARRAWPPCSRPWPSRALPGTGPNPGSVPIDKLQAFYRKFYQPDNVMVVVAGNFKEQKALEYLVKYFGNLKKPARQLDETYTEEPTQDGGRTVVLRRAGSIGVVGAVYHIPAGSHPDFAA